MGQIVLGISLPNRTTGVILTPVTACSHSSLFTAHQVTALQKLADRSQICQCTIDAMATEMALCVENARMDSRRLCLARNANKM